MEFKDSKGREAEIHGCHLKQLEGVQIPFYSEIRRDSAKYHTQTEESVSLICLLQMSLGFFIFL